MAKASPDAPSAAPVPDFVREAIREKAARELATLDQRTAAFDAAEHARATLDALAATLAGATPALVASADSSTVARLKKLRKAVDDATLFADEIAASLGVDTRRDELTAQRLEIERALCSVGIAAPIDGAPIAAAAE